MSLSPLEHFLVSQWQVPGVRGFDGVRKGGSLLLKLSLFLCPICSIEKNLSPDTKHCDLVCPLASARVCTVKHWLFIADWECRLLPTERVH